MEIVNTAIQDILCEFLEIATINILRVRNIYPDYIFVKKKKYGIIVYDVEHPLLKEYLSQTLKGVHYHSKLNQLRSFIILIVQSDKVLERFVFELIELQNKLGSDPLYIKLQEALRTFYLKLCTSDSYLKQLPVDCEFRIQLHSTEYSSLALNEDQAHGNFNWIPAKPSNDVSCNIVPLHTIDLENLVLQMYVETIE